MTQVVERVGRAKLVQEPTREAVQRRLGERMFVSPVEMLVDPLAIAPRVVVMTDFGDAHHERVVGAVTSQFLTRAVALPEIVSRADIPKFDIRKGSYALATLLDKAPEGSVGVAVIDPGVNATSGGEGFRDEVVIKTKAGHHIVIPDNKLATFVALAHGIEEAWRIDHGFFLDGHLNGSSCQGEDLFAPAAAFIGLSTENIKKFATPIDPSDIKRFPVAVGDAIDVDRFGQVRFAYYLPPGAISVDILTESGEVVSNVPVQEEGGFADLPPGKLHVYRSSGFKRPGRGGLAEATIDQQPAVDVIGRDAKIVKVRTRG